MKIKKQLARRQDLGQNNFNIKKYPVWVRKTEYRLFKIKSLGMRQEDGKETLEGKINWYAKKHGRKLLVESRRTLN